MIPLRLTVKNFMCYRDDAPVLDLEGIHVACLCGDNGHGKSALLDAITWALWGEARTRTQDELIHQGQTDMAVELEFESQGQRYRVSRKYSRPRRGKQGHPDLQLQLVTENGVTPITDNTILNTEKKICEILHMDFQTFVSTAFLRQGDADRFTNAKATERKQILAEVLDLSYYDRLEKKARERSRALQDAIRDAENHIAIHQRELARKPEHEETLASVLATIAALTPQAESQKARVDELRRSVDALRDKQRELQELEPRIAEAERDIGHMERQVAAHRRRVADYETVLLREAEICEQFVALRQARSDQSRLDECLMTRTRLEAKRAALEREVAVQRERLTGRAEQLRSRIARELEPKANRLPEIENALAAASLEKDGLGEMEIELGRQRSESQEREAELERMNQALARKGVLDGEKARLEQEIAVQTERLSSQAVQLRSRIERELAPRASRLPEIESGLCQTETEEAEVAQLAETVRLRRQEAEDADGSARYLQQLNAALKAEMEALRKKFDMLEQGEATCPLCNQPLGEEGMEHLRGEYESQGLEKKRQHGENKKEHERLTAKHKELANLVATLEEELDQRRKDVQRKAVALSRDLDDSHKAQEELERASADLELAEATISGKDFAHDQRQRIALIAAEIDTLGYDDARRSRTQGLVRELNAKVSQLDAALARKRYEIDASIKGLEREVPESQKAREELERASADLELAEAALAGEDYALDERQRIAAIDGEIAALGYDEQRHARARKQAQELAGYEELHRKLEDARRNLPVEQESLDTAQQMLNRRQQDIEDGQRRKGALEQELKALPSQERELQQADAQFLSLDRQLKKAEQDKGIVEHELARCAAIEAEVAQREQKRKGLIDEKSIYDDLAAAFGKNGIQALIIESAIPQMEHDANELLGRLTENRMFLRLQLQEGRRRAGVPAEELDIKIADEVGTRSYETFSGGEAFRINFALRIALSKLLARRSGAPLPILFIDEGFGSQDSHGQERLTEAIQSIQHEFKKIIVITHIDAIKDAFPVRIEVAKNGDGSTFKIV